MRLLERGGVLVDQGFARSFKSIIKRRFSKHSAFTESSFFIRTRESLCVGGVLANDEAYGLMCCDTFRSKMGTGVVESLEFVLISRHLYPDSDEKGYRSKSSQPVIT